MYLPTCTHLKIPSTSIPPCFQCLHAFPIWLHFCQSYSYPLHFSAGFLHLPLKSLLHLQTAMIHGLYLLLLRLIWCTELWHPLLTFSLFILPIPMPSSALKSTQLLLSLFSFVSPFFPSGHCLLILPLPPFCPIVITVPNFTFQPQAISVSKIIPRLILLPLTNYEMPSGWSIQLGCGKPAFNSLLCPTLRTLVSHIAGECPSHWAILSQVSLI